MLFKPSGDVYIAGGIAAKILPWMRSQKFMTAYLLKGRMKKIVNDTPVYLVTLDRIGLQGALTVAMQNNT